MAASSENSPLFAREALRLGAERLARAGLASPQLDMSLLLARALGVSRLALYTDLDRPLSEAERLAARELLTRRLAHEPMAYILGEREFFSLTFKVMPDVLIPRPETEHLVEAAIEWIGGLDESDGPRLIADLGTGSGAIAIAVAHACPDTRWIATDISAAALDVARENARRHGIADRIEFRLGSWLEPIGETVDAILANPPYIAETDRAALSPDVAHWEPLQALFGGDDGLDDIREIIDASPRALRPAGLLLIECGIGQAPTIQSLLAANRQYSGSRVIDDLAGIGRIVAAERSVEPAGHP